MSENILIDCPRCRKKIRIPSNTGTIHVTCPACREQWDWPRPRTPLKGATRHAARNLVATFSSRARGLWRGALAPGRFSWSHVIVAWAVGIGIGILVAATLHIGAKPAPPPPENPLIPFDPGLSNAAPVATNILNPPGINPKADEVIPGHVQDLEPAKKNQ
jgi:hypothetical protein